MLSRKKAKFFQCLSYWPTYLILKIFLHFQIKGQENIKDLEKKPLIFASNHASLIDASMIIVSMPRLRGIFCPKFFPIRSLATSHFKLHPIRNFLVIFYIWIHGSIWVNKSNGDLEFSLKEATDALIQGEKILIFPEGKRTKTGELQEGKRGVAFLAKKTKVPIVPVAIINTFKLARPKNLLLALLGIKRPKVIFGKPFYLNEFPETPLENGAREVMEKIKELILTG